MRCNEFRTPGLNNAATETKLASNSKVMLYNATFYESTLTVLIRSLIKSIVSALISAMDILSKHVERSLHEGFSARKSYYHS